MSSAVTVVTLRNLQFVFQLVPLIPGWVVLLSNPIWDRSSCVCAGGTGTVGFGLNRMNCE